MGSAEENTSSMTENLVVSFSSSQSASPSMSESSAEYTRYYQQFRSSGYQSQTTAADSSFSSGYLNDYSDFDASTQHPPETTLNSSGSLHHYLQRQRHLPELQRIPWTDHEVINALREGRCKHLSSRISLEVAQRLSKLLQRPLVRMAREIQRFSAVLRRCGRPEVTSALRVILSRPLATSCLQAASKALALYSMTGDSLRQSKSARSGLRMSVGRMSHWMQDCQVASRISDQAAICLTAAVENLLEELVLEVLDHENHKGSSEVFSLEQLESGIADSATYWGLMQPFEHLICGRNKAGKFALPVDIAAADEETHKIGQGKESRGLEHVLLVTCVGSINELGELVSRCMHLWHGTQARTTNQRSVCPITWSSAAMHTLFYYMKCTQLENEDCSHGGPAVHLNFERPYSTIPPLIEWIRVTLAQAEQRFASATDSDDVRQAARILLPGVDVPPRLASMNEPRVVHSRPLEASTCADKLKRDLAFHMLTQGRADLVALARPLLGSDGLNTFNDQGLTPLMTACHHGDEASVHILLDNGASVNISVPDNSTNYRSSHPDTKQWTALTFATAQGHQSVVQLLLDKGANVDGTHRAKSGQENFAETPLQLAAAAGNYELTSLLLGKGADPYLTTMFKSGISSNYSYSGYNAFSAAASHGHRGILRRLLAQPTTSHHNDELSLKEILMEEREQRCHGHRQKTKQVQFAKENVYQTIDDSLFDSPFSKPSCMKPPRSKSHTRGLQEALYHASEHGYLDVCLELRAAGVPWNVYSWSQSLFAAHSMHQRHLVQTMLDDFEECDPSQANDEFINDCLPLMVDILRISKTDSTGLQLAAILENLYGKEKIVPVDCSKIAAPAHIDPQYVNNPEVSDVAFVIEGKTFFAHKIILLNASPRFRSLLSAKFGDNSQPKIELNDIKYRTFQYVIHYLYHGGTEQLKVETKDVLELLGAANFFMLEGLQRHCESLCSRKLTADNCVAVYKHARLYEAVELTNFCHGYFLQNLSQMVRHDSFKKLIFSSKYQHYDLVTGLLDTLNKRLTNRYSNKKTCSSLCQPPS